MAISLKDQVAIVTGGSRGYGTGIARKLVARGAKVWITGRSKQELANVATAIGARALCADVTSPEDWDNVVKTVMADSGRIDILVNNAGAGIRIAPVSEQSDAEIAESIAVNLTGTIYGCRRVAPIMQEQKAGTIINVASVCATHAWPGWSVYSAAKAGLLQFSKCLYTEMRPHNVRVTCLIPSWGATNFQQAANLTVDDADINARKIQADELGDIVVNICNLPAHLAIEQMTVWPLIQQVEPL